MLYVLQGHEWDATGFLMFQFAPLSPDRVESCQLSV
jgi:hypothetical protein